MDFTKQTFSQARAEESYDHGLRAYMLSVFNHMGIGLAITGFVAMLIASSPQLSAIFFGTPLAYVIMFAPLVMIFMMSSGMATYSVQKAKTMFYIYSGVMGLSLAPIFLIYTGESIARAFFVSASLFGAMSLYGYTTKKDLTSWGSFLMMGVFGLIIASLVNIFMHSSAMQFAISALAVIIFTGLTAYDTQKIRATYYQFAGHGELAQKVAVFGALTLYIDFINIFISLVQLFGTRRD